MKKFIKSIVLATTITASTIVITNKVIEILAGMKDHLPIGGGKFYNWKYGDIYYTKSGKGKPILLIHDLDATSSSYEWNKIIKKLAKKNTVYAIDLLGCGRSEKPNITYTNFLYVQLLNDFIREIIKERTDIVATGDSFSFVIMGCQMEPQYYNKLIGVTPTDLYELASSPNKKMNLLKFLIELPVIGTFIYNIAVSKNRIIDSMVNNYFYKGHLVSGELINAYYQAAHNGFGNGRYLLASIKSNYTNINVVSTLKKINNSICLIGGKEHPFINDVINDYKGFNPAVEDAYISNTTCLPQLEAPDKFVDLLGIVLNS
jgi:pimeloyl-ACP methyl ester carboxylesterase